MEIVFHEHHVQVGDYFRRRAERGMGKLARRLGTVTGATVRVREDAAAKRVEVELDAPGRRLVGRGEARQLGPALTRALEAMSRQVGHLKGARLARVRRKATARRVREA